MQDQVVLLSSAPLAKTSSENSVDDVLYKVSYTKDFGLLVRTTKQIIRKAVTVVKAYVIGIVLSDLLGLQYCHLHTPKRKCPPRERMDQFNIKGTGC